MRMVIAVRTYPRNNRLVVHGETRAMRNASRDELGS